MVGPVVSTTFTINEPVDVFPAVSVAEQSTVVEPSGNVEPEAGEHDGATSPSTRSVAVAEYVTEAPDADVASAVISDGRLSVGPVVSTTFTINEPVDVFPAVSVAEQSTVVEPSGNVEPEAGEHDVATSPSTRSVAVAEYVTEAPDADVASAVISDGNIIVGALLSNTVTKNVVYSELPELSVAEQSTVVEPSGNVEPEAGEHDVATSPSTRSVAVAEYVTKAPDAVTVPLDKI